MSASACVHESVGVGLHVCACAFVDAVILKSVNLTGHTSGFGWLGPSSTNHVCVLSLSAIFQNVL